MEPGIVKPITIVNIFDMGKCNMESNHIFYWKTLKESHYKA